jgi:hypothetical protein
MKVMLLLLYLKINGNTIPDDLQDVWQSQQLAPKWQLSKMSLTDMMTDQWFLNERPDQKQ